MIMYNVTPIIPLYNGFYLFSLSRAVNSNRLIFDLSEVEIHQYKITAYMRVAVKSHALPVYKKNRITSLLCIFETTVLAQDDTVTFE